MEYITSKDDKYKVNENNLNINRSIACSKTTREGNTRADTTDYICEELPENFNIKNGCKQIYDLNYYNHEQSNRVYSVNYSSPTLRTKSDEAGTIKIKCSNKSLQETLEQNEIDDTCYIDTYNKRIDKDKSGTITTGVSFRNITFLAIKNATQKGYLEATDGDGIDLAQPNSETRRGRVQKNAIQTLTTQNNLGVCVGTYQYAKSDKFMQGKERLQLGKQVSDTLQTTQKEGIVNNDLKIRKLTPKECFRLMGVKDEDFEKVAKNQSDSSLYHLAGDSIVVNVLMAIFKEMI
jgi:DNA (cytosine-5)-methyltransferase 1